MRKIALSGLASVALVLPALASAQTLLNTLALVNTFLNAMIGLFITLAIVVFFWGLIKYLVNAGEQNLKVCRSCFMALWRFSSWFQFGASSDFSRPRSGSRRPILSFQEEFRLTPEDPPEGVHGSVNVGGFNLSF